MKRNNVSGRFASNIKRARASVDEEVVNEFFDHLERMYDEMGDLPAGNVFNYDETNLCDDPGKKWVMVRRGRRRVENVKEYSKTSISIMFCGSAAGVMIPPMVVYRALNLYEGWVRGGPRGTVYSCTKNWWFDGATFQKWFTDCFLPAVRDLPGKKVLFGDNLASHFNPEVVRLAKENDIFFVMLPANATNMFQPLDVTVYGPMKRAWHRVLDVWRNETRRVGSFPKENFPGLLKQLCLEIKDNVSTNLTNGFAGCALFPCDRAIGLSKLPGGNAVEISACLSETLIDLLRKNRSTDKPKKPRGKKVPCVAGQVLAVPDDGEEPEPEPPVYKYEICHEEDDDDDDDVPWTGCETCDNIWYHDKCLHEAQCTECIHCEEEL